MKGFAGEIPKSQYLLEMVEALGGARRLGENLAHFHKEA